MDIIINMSYLLFMSIFIQFSHTEFTTQQRKPKVNYCDNIRNAALVEHFFNIIFNEFQHTPPICVCVQMCIHQPTYCYPNGCLKRNDGEQQQNVEAAQKTIATTMIPYVDKGKDFMANFLDVSYGDLLREKSEQPSFRPDIFKDRYKMLFKYKRMPKVELRYNIREQVNSKRTEKTLLDRIEISQPIWPSNRHLYGQKQYLGVDNENTFFDKREVKKLSQRFSDNQQNYSPRYYKRAVNVDEMLGENITFSLENLIDSLIEINIEISNNTGILNENNSSYVNATTTVPVTIITEEMVTTEFVVNENYTYTNLSTVSTAYTSVTTNTTNVNMSEDIFNFTTHESNGLVHNETVDKVTVKQSDRQNDTSMEFIEQFADINFEETTITSTPRKSTNDIIRGDVTNVTHNETSTRNVHTDFLATARKAMFTNRMKSRQRITRKLLQKRKIN